MTRPRWRAHLRAQGWPSSAVRALSRLLHWRPRVITQWGYERELRRNGTWRFLYLTLEWRPGRVVRR